ncbi:elongation of very long chain fatty acids protein AAEL008004-like [Hyposmocoma kahamanoa]|uniref:elongation of very long chain fatty acids protein AAEL008004-like n=1 Tax=Hyposmocoma kahamanoa TaxID=1477025 RepID=UPI000E6D89B5|nr:elongation of very long chain fatty acids protein AAEL008004-like [Hyposmocoma kahamanoa]
MSYLEKIDRYLDSLKVGKSAMVDSWFMMSSPVPIMSVVASYFLLIRIGPRIMKNRPPMQMNKLLAYYNAFQVLLAAMICIKVLKLSNMFRDGIFYAGCRYPSHTLNPMVNMKYRFLKARYCCSISSTPSRHFQRIRQASPKAAAVSSQLREQFSR